MNGLALCNKGIEDICASEIKELIGCSCKVWKGHVLFKIKKKEELCKVVYMSQSVRKVVLLVDKCNFDSEEDILEKISKLDLKEWLDSKKRFKAEIESDNPKIDVSDIRGKIGEKVIENIKKYKQKVDLENPDVVFFTYINENKAYFGIDFSGKDLSKRSYRIFSSPKNIKSTIAYAMVRLSGYKKGEVLVDPFCISGSVAIEAALFENKFPVRYFDKEDFAFDKFMSYDFKDVKNKSKDKARIYAFDSLFKNVDASKKNAKIAGVNKSINFSRLDIGWMDIKFDKESVDRIICCIPNISKSVSKGEVLKVYKEFFYQAEFVLSKKGSIVVCVRESEELKKVALEKGFKIEEEREVWQGQERLFLLRFEK
jgi:23S rRNA G2445 N2-methylase RlmL